MIYLRLYAILKWIELFDGLENREAAAAPLLSTFLPGGLYQLLEQPILILPPCLMLTTGDHPHATNAQSPALATAACPQQG